MILIITTLCLGVATGSFLAMCIYRIPFASLALEEEIEAEEGVESSLPPTISIEPPFKDLSISNPPRSFCPECLQQLKWWHNLPVISWLLLKGRCAFCKTRIPVRYPLIELVTGITALLCYMHFGLTPTALVLFIFCCALIVITVIDYDHYIIPNVISLPGTIMAFLIAVINEFTGVFAFPIVPGIKESLVGLFSGSVFLFVIAEFYLRVRKIEGLGMGDVKLLAMSGALLGVEASMYTIFFGSLLGAIIGLALMLIQGRKFTHAIPFGPFLAIATAVYIFISPNAIEKTFEFFSGVFG